MFRGLHRTLFTALTLAALSASPVIAQTSTGGTAVQPDTQPDSDKTLDQTKAKPGTQGGEEPGAAATTGSVTQPETVEPGKLNQDQQSPTTLQEQKGQPGTQSGSEPVQQ